MARGKLSGLRVLVTRPAHQAGPLCGLIEQAGGEAVPFPVLTVEAVAETDSLRSLLEHLNDYWLAIFISPNAVRFGLEAVARHGAIPANLLLATVGAGSRRELERRLERQVDLVPQDRYNSEALLALPALQQVAGKRIIIFRGRGGRELLAQTLQERGARVEYAEVYRRARAPAPDRDTLSHWMDGGVNAITVTSTEGLQNLYGMMNEEGRDWLLGQPLVVVSESCAALARQLGFRLKALVAPRTSNEAIVESLAGWARSNTGICPGEERAMSETENSQPEPEPAIEHSTPTPAAEQAAPVARKKATSGGKRLAVFAIVITLLVAAMVLVFLYDLRKLHQQNLAMEAQLQSTVASLEQHDREQSSALSAEARERDKMLMARQESLEQGMQAIREQLGSDHGEWMAAESDYLLRIANRRLMLERDVRGALLALHSADELLADGASPLYLPVREQIHSEIAALEAVTQVDVDGIALELSGLSKQLDTLPLAVAHPGITRSGAQAAQPAANKGPVVKRFFGAMWDALKTTVSVRHLDQKVLPLIPPEQHYFLTQNLRLRLEMARLALLRGDAALYQESLTTAGAWLDEYFDREDTAVKHGRDVVARLAKINITPALPDISASARTLERIRGRQADKKPAPNRDVQP